MPATCRYRRRLAMISAPKPWHDGPMVYRKGERTKRQLRAAFPHQIKIRVPGDGLGNRLALLDQAADRIAGADGWAGWPEMLRERSWRVYGFAVLGQEELFHRRVLAE